VSDEEAAERRRVALHESAHSFAAFAMGRPVLGLSVVPHRRWAGSAHFGQPRVGGRDWARWNPAQPYALWPARVRRSFEIRGIFFAAGDAAEDMLHWPAIGATRTPDPQHVQVIEAPEPSVADRQRFAAAEATMDGLSDVDMLGHIAVRAFPDDPDLRVEWLRWIDGQARSIVTTGAAQIERLADAAQARGRLGGRAVRSILTDTGEHVD
jgi:hypothetical protein